MSEYAYVCLKLVQRSMPQCFEPEPLLVHSSGKVQALYVCV